MSHSRLEIASVWAKQKEKGKGSRTRSGPIWTGSMSEYDTDFHRSRT